MSVRVQFVLCMYCSFESDLLNHLFDPVHKSGLNDLFVNLTVGVHLTD